MKNTVIKKIKSAIKKVVISTIKFDEIIPKDNFIINRIKGKTVLDIGCVDGSLDIFMNYHDQWLHEKIKNNASEVLGIDILEDEVKALQQKGFNIKIGDATNFISEKKYDRIVCGDIIEHLANPGDLLACCFKNMKDDGELIICTPKSVFGNFSFYSYKKACGQKKTVRGSKNSRRLSNGTPAI